MRRLALIVLGLLAVCVVIALAISAGVGKSGYVVAAVFDNSGAIVAGEDVDVAGAVVGTVQSLGLTRNYRAVLALHITDRAFIPFHRDASCIIRSEGVLAVEFVDCDPGTSGSPPLGRGGAGAHELPVQQTSSPVEFDLVTNIYREPAGEYLATLLDELGTGLAAQGSDLNAVIRRADPGLEETDQVLQVLDRQDAALGRLAVNAKAALGPLAAARASLARFVTQAAITSQAPAQESAAVQASIARLPGFLHALRATLVQLGALSEQGLPVLTDLRAGAPGLDAAVAELRPFAIRGTPAFRNLGRFATEAIPALQGSRLLVENLAELGRHLVPVSSNLSALTSSFEQQDGITHLMQLLFYGANSVNGFDALGHYARSELLSSACSEYTGRGFFGCAAQFGGINHVAKPVPARDTEQLGARVVQSALRSGQLTSTSTSAAAVETKLLLGYLLGDR